MSRLDNSGPKRLKSSSISYRVCGLIFCCLILLIGISWTRLLSPSARSAEADVVEEQASASSALVISSPTDPATTPEPAIAPATATEIASAPVASDPVSSAATVAAITPVPPIDKDPLVEFKPLYIPVLNYHSITIDPGNRAVITPLKFEAQMNYLARNGYKTLSLQQFIDYMDNKATGMPEKPILLTFDDGYADNHEYALPILRKLQFQATMFVSPGTTEDGYFLNWDQIKEMHQAGWDIQPHGMTHPHLPKLAAKDQAFEITEAKRQIEEKLNIKSSVFCYPYGERNATTLKLLKDNGFRYAFTIDQGMTTRSQDPYLLKRIFVNGEETLEQWIAKLEKKAVKTTK
jgi:peptidoglycan/xylan/chitin deacetylase (PgdA/CDA1 family)